MYRARKLADSISLDGVRVTTIEATFPRFILAEINTHRVFSRNSASSRAIPPERIIERIWADPFIPETFNQRVKGMGVGKKLDEKAQAKCIDAWITARDASIRSAHELIRADVDKSRINRLLEPWMWHTAIITSTEWENFFALRCPDGDKIDFDFPAQPEFQQIAILMRAAMDVGSATVLQDGEWHRPMVDVNVDGDEIYKAFKGENDAFYTDALNRLASRRLARVSFDKHTEAELVAASIDKAGQLVGSGHFSPTEHVCRPLTEEDIRDPERGAKIMVPASEVVEQDGNLWTPNPATAWSGNLRGFWQYRKEFAHESNHRLSLEA